MRDLWAARMLRAGLDVGSGLKERKIDEGEVQEVCKMCAQYDNR